MNAVFKFISLAIFPVCTFAAEGGVANTNFEAGINYSQSRDSENYSVGGSVTLPVYSFVGANLNANASHQDGKDDQIDSDSHGLGGNLFLRDFNIGKIGLGYSYSKTSFDLPSWLSPYVDDDSESDHYRIFGQYYLGDFTLSAIRYVSEAKEADERFNGLALSAAWYATENVRTSLDASAMDSKDNYGITVEYQPELFQNAASVSFSYADGRKDDTFSVGFNYFFGTKVSLKDRDRKYR
ncbi:hypothetical protein [Hahella sp. HN01]|uniref:hypothetical protein n=1 Tax=unclassified Hahella TaxID=2624107 RepID=UPI001C1ED0D8|nr:hypothetical protein [Hahella sp. HN01]MBU6954063.1 hypothetical protein [Hahella sp. HN01]